MAHSSNASTFFDAYETWGRRPGGKPKEGEGEGGEEREEQGRREREGKGEGEGDAPAPMSRMHSKTCWHSKNGPFRLGNAHRAVTS